MSYEIKISSSININKPQKELFGIVMDWDAQKNWIPFTTVKPFKTQANKVGDQISAFTGIGRIGFLDTMTISKWQYPEICEVKHTGKFIKGKGIFAVSSVDSNSAKFEWTEITTLPLGRLGIVLLPFAWLISKASLEFSLKRLEKHIKKSN
jgi:hypothetical protein